MWRHLPLTDVHPQAQLAAQASEAAAEQDKFWQMHDLLLDPPGHADQARPARPTPTSSASTCRGSREDLTRHGTPAGSAQDVESADISGVSGTPTFFVNGRRHYGAYDVATLTQAIAVARDRARVESRR